MSLQGKMITEYSSIVQPGDFWLTNDVWYAMTPNGLIANLGAHKVIYNQNDTITVSPSILVDNGQISWHGFLEMGVWREV